MRDFATNSVKWRSIFARLGQLRQLEAVTLLSEEGVERGVRLLRCFLGEVMTTIDCLALDIVCPVAPNREDVIPVLHRTPLAPQCQQWTGDLVTGGNVGFVEGEVVAGARAIVLAHRVDRLG